MKKIIVFFITILPCILFITSCRPNTHVHNFIDGECSCGDKITPPALFSIKNMEESNGGYYYKYLNSDTESVDLTKYIETNQIYKIKNINPSTKEVESECLSNEKSIFDFIYDSIYLEIEYNNKVSILHFYHDEIANLKVVFDGINTSKIYQFKIGTKLNINLFDINIEGFSLVGTLIEKDLINLGLNKEEVNIEDFYIYNDELEIIILLNKNEVTVKLDDLEFKVNAGDEISYIPIEKTGYTFVGWVSKKTNELVSIYYPSEHGYEFDSFYQANTYKITRITPNEEVTEECIFNTPIPIYNPEMPGYDFVGWYYNDLPLNNIIYDFAHDIVLNAKFEPKKYHIHFANANQIDDLEVSYDSNYILPIPTLDNKKFLYWMYDGKILENGKWNYLNDITVVAVWEEVEEISLNLETFGGNLISNAQVDKDGNITLPVAKKENYKFVGWYKDYTLKNEVKILNTSEYNNEILYAKYEYDSQYLVGEITITKYNQHASEFDEIAMFDKTKSGFTSKYWHKIGISKNESTYYISSIAINGESLSTLGDYEFVVLAYTDCPDYSYFVNMPYQIGYNVSFTVDPYSLDSGNQTIQMSFLMPNIDDDIDKVKEALNNMYQDYEIISDNIELIKNIYGYGITWKTSNKNALSSDGKYQKPYVTRNVTLSAWIGEVEVYSFSVSVAGEKESSDALATGYIYTPYNITQNAMNTLDIIYCAFLEIDESANWTNYSRMKSNLNTYILPKAKISNTKVVISVNQAKSGAFSSVAKSAELRQKLATNIVSFIKEFDLDGIDIDWETPSQSESTNFTLLMKEIYEEVKTVNKDYLVTAAIGGGKWAPPKYDLPNSKNYLDYINLMTYSMASSSGYYQNSLFKSTKGATLVSCSIEESIDIYNDLGVKNSQILVGIPFYTTVQTSSGGPGSKTGDGKSVWYDTMLEKYPLSNTMKEYFDEECGVPYRYDSVNKIFISYDNERSIQIKCDYINTLGLAGIMYWQYGQDVDDMLSNAIDEYINK